MTYSLLVRIIWKLESNWSTALATSLLGPTVILDDAKLAIHAGVVLNFPAFEKFLPGHDNEFDNDCENMHEEY